MSSQPYKPKVKESSVLAACMAWLYNNGLRPIRNNTGVFTKKYTNKKTGSIIEHHIHCGRIGSGDIICCTKTGRYLEIEAKSSAGKQRDDQIARQQHIEGLGGLYILAHSLDDLEARKGELLT